MRRTLIVTSVLLLSGFPGGAGRLFFGCVPTRSAWDRLAAPEALDRQEEEVALQGDLARLYNPAMAFTTPDIWPVDVSYAWRDGSGISARAMDGEGRVRRRFAALEHERLSHEPWDDLPDRDRSGERLEYFVDGPGDDRRLRGLTAWRRRWRQIPASERPPTQYAHVFWFNRARGLLGIQYWFYYPFNEWLNHHEGDWEHITVILEGPRRLTAGASFHPVGHQMFFHRWVYDPKQVVHVAGDDPRERHVLVYVGGRARLFGWSGVQSGGSYPLPAVFRGAGGGVGILRPSDDTRDPQNFIHASAFRVVMLPEPARLDSGSRPELSWLRLSFFAGQESVIGNFPLLEHFLSGGAPEQPARRRDWNGLRQRAHWPGERYLAPQKLRVPAGWRVELVPGQSASLHTSGAPCSVTVAASAR